MRDGRIAIPSEGEGGLDGIRAGHFGHCQTFTLVDVENGEIKSTATLANRPHVEGGCMVPVNLLAQQNVNAIIVGGMGMRPLMGFRQVGIDVYFEGETPGVRDVVELLVNGKLPAMGDEMACGAQGHGHHHP
jgi:predicted Fe-Mo cluster-binding NifX family protein